RRSQRRARGSGTRRHLQRYRAGFHEECGVQGRTQRRDRARLFPAGCSGRLAAKGPIGQCAGTLPGHLQQHEPLELRHSNGPWCAWCIDRPPAARNLPRADESARGRRVPTPGSDGRQVRLLRNRVIGGVNQGLGTHARPFLFGRVDLVGRVGQTRAVFYRPARPHLTDSTHLTHMTHPPYLTSLTHPPPPTQLTPPTHPTPTPHKDLFSSFF